MYFYLLAKIHLLAKITKNVRESRIACKYQNHIKHNIYYHSKVVLFGVIGITECDLDYGKAVAVAVNFLVLRIACGHVERRFIEAYYMELLLGGDRHHRNKQQTKHYFQQTVFSFFHLNAKQVYFTEATARTR